MQSRHVYQLITSLLCAGCLLLTGGLQAQGVTVSSGTGAGTGSVLVEPQAVMDRAASAFSESSEHLVESLHKTDVGKDVRQRIDRLKADIGKAFGTAVGRKVAELRGDGVLTAKEVSEAVGRLRENYIEELSEAVSAVVEGHRPPPMARNYTNGLNYTVALLRYTLARRNGAADWLFVGGALVGGLGTAWLGNTALRSIAERPRRRTHMCRQRC